MQLLEIEELKKGFGSKTFNTRIEVLKGINLKINKMGCNFSIIEGTLSKALSVGILSLALTFPLL